MIQIEFGQKVRLKTLFLRLFQLRKNFKFGTFLLVVVKDRKSKTSAKKRIDSPILRHKLFIISYHFYYQSQRSLYEFSFSYQLLERYDSK